MLLKYAQEYNVTQGIFFKIEALYKFSQTRELYTSFFFRRDDPRMQFYSANQHLLIAFNVLLKNQQINVLRISFNNIFCFCMH